MGADDPGRVAAPRGGRLSESQPVLFGRRPPRARKRAGGDPVAIAQVCVDAPGAHLDHPFSYSVPEALSQQVRPGVRVKVGFAGTDTDGWVLAVDPVPAGPLAGAGPAAARELRPVRRVVSPIAVLDPLIAVLARQVADHYAGTLADVLRTAVPPRHAAAETALRAEVDGTAAAALLDGPTPAAREPEQAESDQIADVSERNRLESGPAGPGPSPDPGGWAQVRGGEAFLRRIAAGEDPAAAACLPAVVDPWRALGVLARHAMPRTALILVPDAADLNRASAAVRGQLDPAARLIVLSHDLGPAARWQAFLRILAGLADVVVGTRSAAFAPLPRLGVVAVWDDGDDGHAEPRSPGWHVRVVAARRARLARAALVLTGHARSAATQWLVERGEVKSLEAPRASRRSAARVFAPRRDDPLEGAARVPRSAHSVIADGLGRGPVLVSVPRRGYAPGLSCGRCREPARCRLCVGGRLSIAESGAAPGCRWCGRDDPQWVCAVCGATSLRAAAVGGRRTAEELGRAFPGTAVLSSDGARRIDVVPSTAGLVVATPGAEPVAEGGYAAAAILDGDASLQRPGLTAPEDTVRRWLHVVSLVRGTGAGGTVVLVGDPEAAPVQAVVSAAPERFAGQVCAERAQSGLPPATSAATMVGDLAAVADAASRLRGEGPPGEAMLSLWPVAGSGDSPVRGPDHDRDGVEHRRLQVLGPVPAGDAGTGRKPDQPQARLLLLGEHDRVVTAARDVLARRAARHAVGVLTVRVDPIDL